MIERLRGRASGGRLRTRDAAPGAGGGPASEIDPDGLEARLVWIWGSPRSGGTWLLRLLGHPLDPDPDSALGYTPPAEQPRSALDTLPVDETFISNHLAPALADPRIVDGRWTPGSLNNLLSSRPAYVFSDEYAEIWEPAAKTLALTRLRGVLARGREARIPFTDDPLVVIKETNGSHAADIVMRIMSQSRMLLLIRDARDVVDSLLHAYQPGGFFAAKQGREFKDADERTEGLEWAARLWACNTDMTLKAIEAHDPRLTRTVRYEDLLADTAGELGGLLEWLELPRAPGHADELAERYSFSSVPDELKGPLTRNRAARPGLWRENLSEAEQDRVNEICGPLLERFGYEL